MRRLTVIISEELIEGLEDIAELNGTTLSDVLRDVVTGYLFSGPWSSIGGVAKKSILPRKTNEEVLPTCWPPIPAPRRPCDLPAGIGHNCERSALRKKYSQTPR